MRFRHLFARRRRPRLTFRPAVRQLEDRSLPSTLGHRIPHPGLFGPATQFALMAPRQVQSGQQFHVLVLAETANQLPAPGYTGTVHFTLGTADPSASLPADYTFTAADHGIHVFTFTLAATGGQTITATDTSTAITGNANLTVNGAATASQFLLLAPHQVIAATPSGLLLVAEDAQGHPVPGYTGTVHFTSSDGGATLPADYTFQAGDHGAHLFGFTLAATGSQTLTVTDTANTALTATATITVNAAPVATQFLVLAPSQVLAGSPHHVLVVAEDAHGRPVPNYSGTVHFTSSDGSATLPADYTFQTSDHGAHLFSFTLATAGSQTLTVTDTANSGLTGSATVMVNAGPVATQFAVIVPGPVTAGSPSNVLVVAEDVHGRRVRNYTGTVHFTSSDGSAGLPADYTFQAGDRGTHFFPVTFQTTGSQTLTVTDTANSALTGQATVTVNAAMPATHFLVFTFGVAFAGVPTEVFVVALDANNHVVPGYTGTIHFTSTDGSASLPADYTFQSSDRGAQGFAVTFATTGPQTVTVTDTTDNTITGSGSVWVF